MAIIHYPMGHKTIDIDIDPDQAYFWTPEWQNATVRAIREVRAGLTEEFETMTEFIKTLEKKNGKRRKHRVGVPKVSDGK